MEKKWKIPLYKVYTDDEDFMIIEKVIRRGTEWAIGPEIEEFENAIKQYVGRNYCASLNSGTSALHATYLAYGFGKNDEIIVPSFTFISTANSVLFVNATPKFADIENETLGLDPGSIVNKITKSTKAIVPVDIGGLSCKIFEIQKIAEDNKLVVIEDAAESLGSKVNNRKVGSITESAIFSFCGNKVLTTGEGGAIVTDSKELFEKIKLIRSHGRVDKLAYFNNPDESQYVDIGYNWRMSSMTAALGISQLQKLDKIIKMRQENANYISSHISKYPGVSVPTPPKNFDHIYQMYTIKLADRQLRDELKDFLTKKEIFSKVYFSPVHMTSFYKQKFGNLIHLPNTEQLSEQVLTLPLYPNMTAEEKEYLTNSIAEFFESR